MKIVEIPIQRIVHQKGYIKALEFEDGNSQGIEALYHRPVFTQHCSIPEKLGCLFTDSGHIEVNEFQQTNVPGIYAIGDCTTLFRSVANAVAQGNIGAAMLNHELIKLLPATSR